jgi:hypothetical protein
MEFGAYRKCPSSVQEELIAEAQKKQKAAAK